LLGTFIHEKRDVFAAFLQNESTKSLHYFLQIIYRPLNAVFYTKYFDLRPRQD
jgi:hypothetical protein